MRKLLCIICLSSLTFSVFSQDRRLALVIGNSAYKQAWALKTVANDASAISNVLRQSGFEVLDYYDLDYDNMITALRNFGSRMADYDVGLFYYAGHGIQKNGENYLIPVDADINPGQLVEDVCIRADRALIYMNVSGSSVNIMVLDACRDSPFERSWNRTSESRGLAAMEAPRGTLIAFAASPGKTSLDGDEDTGIYTSAIVENIRVPDIRIERLFKNVSSMVSARTNGQQIPWESASITNRFYLREGAASDFYRTGIVFQSVAFPGLGLSRATRKPHWIKGLAGYSCIAGSVMLNRSAVNTYNEFLGVYEPEEADRLLSRSTLQDNLSETLAYTAIGIWAVDIVWTIIGSSGLTKGVSKSKNPGLSMGGGIDPLLWVPVIEFVYRF